MASGLADVPRPMDEEARPLAEGAAPPAAPARPSPEAEAPRVPPGHGPATVAGFLPGMGPATAVPGADAAAALADLAERVALCRRCSLGQERSKAVPGEGPTRSRVMFVGEAPGAEEDATGRPFVGPAGQLLTRIIENGMRLPRSRTYICNVLKCRPPGNREPAPEEREACAPFLEEQIALVRPDLIVALGRHAAVQLLRTQAPLNQLRGRLHPRPFGGPPVLVTFHPAYLLRNPSAKADCWRDIQVAMGYLGLGAAAEGSRRALSGSADP